MTPMQLSSLIAQIESESRPRNINSMFTICAKPYKKMFVGQIMLISTSDFKKWQLDNKADHLLPCDGSPIDKGRFPELYAVIAQSTGDLNPKLPDYRGEFQRVEPVETKE